MTESVPRKQPSSKSSFRMTQPPEMMTKTYICGVDKLNGFDAWALFEASAAGDVPKEKALVAKDRRLVNAQSAYQFPIHMAVYAGHAEIVRLLLNHDADPGQSTYTYNSWDKLLLAAKDRGCHMIEAILRRAMIKKFHFTPDFDVLKDSIITRDVRRIGAALRRQPDLARGSDALGNNAIHWAVITRQLALIERFVEAGTPIDSQRADGQTPVLLAVNGATDYWYRETRGRSFLHECAEKGERSMAAIFLDAGADINAREVESQGTPLAAAVRSSARQADPSQAERLRQMIAFLLKRGAATSLPDDNPWSTPLAWATRHELSDLVELLTRHSAN